jgi:hypothetical protein
MKYLLIKFQQGGKSILHHRIAVTKAGLRLWIEISRCRYWTHVIARIGNHCKHLRVVITKELKRFRLSSMVVGSCKNLKNHFKMFLRNIKTIDVRRVTGNEINLLYLSRPPTNQSQGRLILIYPHSTVDK